jgi:lysophospholipase L1-like esterase
VVTAVGAVALLALELAGLFVPALSAAALDPDRALVEQARVEPHPYLGYANRPGFTRQPYGLDRRQISHNALGLRGPETTWAKPPGVYRILCVGGSSTYGDGCTSDATTWPARLQAHLADAVAPLEVEVLNAGCQGWSTFESLINLSLRGVDLEPDLVVVYHAINDVRCALWNEPAPDNAHWRAVWPVERPSAPQRWLERTTTWRLLRSLDPAWRAGRGGDLGRYAIAGYPGDEHSYDTPSDLGFASVRRNLASLVAVARAHGAQVVLGLQGVRWSDLDGIPGAAAQREGLRRVLAVTREVGAELDVPVVDLASALESEARRQVADGGRDRVFTREVHLTDEGADLLARTLARSLLELGLTP